MANMEEIKNSQELEAVYEMGSDIVVPPISKEYARSYYTKESDSFFRMSRRYWQKEKGKSEIESKRRSAFGQDLFGATFRHLDKEDRTQLLQTFFHQMYSESRNGRVEDAVLGECLHSVAWSTGGLSAELREAMDAMPLHTRVEVRYLAEQYRKYADDLSRVMKSVSLTPLNAKDKVAFDTKEIVHTVASLQSFEAMQGLMLAAADKTSYNHDVLSAYFSLAADHGHDVLTFLQASDGKALSGMNENDARNLMLVVDRATRGDKTVGVKLLEEALRLGFDSKLPEVKDNYVFRLAQKRWEGDRFIAGEVDYPKSGEKPDESMAQFKEVVRANPDKIDAIIIAFDTKRKDRVTEDVYVRKAFTELMGDERVPQEARLKIASRMMKSKTLATDRLFVGTVLDSLRKMDNPHGVAYNILLTQLKGYAQKRKSIQGKMLDEGTHLRDARETQMQACMANVAYEGALTGEKLVSTLRQEYEQVAQYDKDKNKPVLSKQQAEELVVKALKGEHAAVPQVEAGFFDRFSSSSKQRIEMQNKALLSFYVTLESIRTLPVNVVRAKRDYLKALDKTLKEGGYASSVSSVRFSKAQNAGAKEMLSGLQGRIFADSTLAECKMIVNQKADEKRQHPIDVNKLFQRDGSLQEEMKTVHKVASLTMPSTPKSKDDTRTEEEKKADIEKKKVAGQQKRADRQASKDRDVDLLAQRQDELKNKGENMQSRKEVATKTTSPAVQQKLAERYGRS